MHAQPHDLGLYIHVPFCQKRCHFCAFYLMAHRDEHVQRYLAALAQEIVLFAKEEACGRFPISTIYFGGGTPTSLESEQLEEILLLIRQHFTVHPSAEISVEADPHTVNEASLESLYKIGVNRLSFGVQTLENPEWQRLGRSGEMAGIYRVLEQVKDIGFSNVNLDLMYGLPEQTLETWQRSLESVVDLQPNHVACYALTIEEGTYLHRDIQRGRVTGNDFELETAMQELATNFLHQAGYHQYEVSNFTQFGRECQHNLRYWSGLDYLGLGPSAQSYIGGMRFGNISDLVGYSHSLERQQLPVESCDILSREDVARERVIFGLRMNKGIPTFELQAVESDVHWQSTVDRLIDSGLLVFDNQHLKATSKGRRFIDEVAVQLM